MSTDTVLARPLSGKTVLVVSSPLKSEPLIAGLESLGASVRQFQAIAVRRTADAAVLDAALTSIASYSWVIFTSAYAVIYFARRMAELRVPAEQLAHVEVCAIGPATARKSAECGIRVSLVPDEFVAEGVLKALAGRPGGLQALAGRKILFPRAKEAREVLPAALTAAGAIVDVAVCYETVQAEPDHALMAKIRSEPPEVLVFTSSSNAAHFASIMGDADCGRLLATATVAALGPITAGTLESLGKRPEVVPPRNTIPSLLESIRIHFARS